MKHPIPKCPSLREALSLARQWGCLVEFLDSSGEVRVTHDVGKVVVNARKKDASRRLVSLLRHVERGVG
jgi:hypothetical protein